VSDDLVIVGAGPAGIHAAILARRSGLPLRLLEASGESGGQLRRTWSRLTAVPDHDGPGIEYAAVLARRLAEAGVVAENVEATGLGRRGRHFEVALAGGVAIGARAVLVATGLRARTLDVPGERELRDHGVSPSATRDRAQFAGRPVAVVGGGDAAYENALLLAATGSPVTLVVRGTPRARDEFRKRVASERRVTVLEGARVAAIRGEREVQAIEVTTREGARAIEVAGVFVKIGAVPNSIWCRKALDCDREGFVKADLSRATSMKGVWAAGDVTRPERFTVRSAMADAAIAVQFARKFLEG
jgi:thioredoxin reductase